MSRQGDWSREAAAKALEMAAYMQPDDIVKALAAITYEPDAETAADNAASEKAMDAFYAQLDADLAEQDVWEARVARVVAILAEAWRARWPNACTACYGSGGFVTRNYPHAPDDFEPCEGRDFFRMCHRCSGWSAIEDEDGGQCLFCGWNWGRNPEDAMPT